MAKPMVRESGLVQETATRRAGQRTARRLLETIIGKPATPMERVEREFSRQRTADRTGAMEKGLMAVLSRDGYSQEFRSEVLAMAPGRKADLVFGAAFGIFERENGHIATHAAALLEDVIPKASREQMHGYLMYGDATRLIATGSGEKRAAAARLLARICRKLGTDSERLVDRISNEMAGRKAHGTPAEKAAAEVFMKSMEFRIIDLKSVA